MSKMKKRGRLVGGIHWSDEHHEVAIRMFQRGVYLKIREAVARLGIIRHQDPTSHLLNMRKFRVNERDRRGRISTFFGFALRKEINGDWYDLTIETEHNNDDCLRLVLREHRPWRSIPDDRCFIIHRDRRDNAYAIESFPFHGYFLKVDPNSEKLCMVKTPRNLFGGSKRRVVGFHPHYKFEIISDPPSVPLPDPDSIADPENENVPEFPEEPNIISHRGMPFQGVTESRKRKGPFKRFVRFFTCGYNKKYRLDQ